MKAELLSFDHELQAAITRVQLLANVKQVRAKREAVRASWCRTG